MNTGERLKCLQNDLDKLVSRYSGEAKRYKKTALMLKITSVVFAALITVLLGLSVEQVLKDTLRNISLALGAVITVLSAYEAFFDPRALWIRETVTFARLKDLQRDLRFWSSDLDNESMDSHMVDMFKQRLDRILNDSLKYWMKVRGAPDVESREKQNTDQTAEDSTDLVQDIPKKT